MTERLYALAILGSLGGCGKDKDDDSQAPAECMTQLTGTLPVNGASDAYYRADIEATFDAADDTSMITLYDSSGTPVDGSEHRNDDATGPRPSSVPIRPCSSTQSQRAT